jgi:3-dehydroquinate synthase
MYTNKFDVKVDPSYPVFIVRNLLNELSFICNFKACSSVVAVIDSQVYQIFSNNINKVFSKEDIILIPGGEASKDVATVTELWQFFEKRKLDRKSLVVNIGGGACSDVAGFAASSYMRGVAFIQVPTTILAQVDASIGGKNGINFQGVKNLIGNFAQPRAVVIDTDFITHTEAKISNRHLLSGVAEMIKHGLIYSALHSSNIKKFVWKNLEKKPEELEVLLLESCKIKADIVIQDPKEQSIRKLLNFGHTVGHALEAISHEINAPLLHGEAVALGMRAEVRMAVLSGICEELVSQELDFLLQKVGFPLQYDPVISYEQVKSLMESDKKSVKGTIFFAVPTKIGVARFNVEFTPKIIRSGLEYVVSSGSLS